MNILLMLNLLAALIIFIWSTWCIVSVKFNDGIFGKLLLAVVALASLAVLAGPQYGYDKPQQPDVTLNVAISLLAFRHLMIKYVWARVVRRWRYIRGANQ